MAKKDKNTDNKDESSKKVQNVKKVKEDKDENVLSFDQINKELDKISLYGSKMSENTFSEIDHYISFGNYIVNACASGSIFGGIPNNRMVALAGPSGSGKTFLLLNAIKNAVDMGYIVIFYDTENAIDRQLMVKFGIDVSKVRYEPMSTLQEFRHHITNFIDTLIQKKRAGIKIPKIFFALDSAGNLPSQKEVNDAIEGNEKADMTRAKLIKSVFRIITVPLAELKAPFVFTNHTYQCLGKGAEVLLSDGTFKEIQDIQIGDVVKTLEGDKPVIDTTVYENVKTYTIELEDGTKLTGVDKHRFLVKDNWKNEESWKQIDELKPDDILLAIEKNRVNLKIKSVYPNEKKENVYDISVKDSEHYILKNGIVSHNTQSFISMTKASGGTGIEYAASIILFLSKSQLTEGSGKTKIKSGIVVKITPNKNRFSKPNVVNAYIRYDSGMNPYVGLEEYLDWDTVGVDKGEIDKNGDIIINKKAKTWVAKHIDGVISKASQLYSSAVFTPEVLKAIDEHTKPIFSYGINDEIPDNILSDEDVDIFSEELDDAMEEVDE
jgi:RecA/RadA recombinase